MQIDNMTEIIGVIASKKSNLGIAMHTAAYEQLQLNFAYIPFAVENCKDAIIGLRALHLRGCSVSMPYKQEVMKYIDAIDPVAEKIGAINTIVNNNNKLTGYNTDWLGALKALQEVTDIERKNVVLLGAGGAARAIVYALKKYNAHITIFNRTVARGEQLANDFDITCGGNLTDVESHSHYDILINATSVGFLSQSDELPIPIEAIYENRIVFEVPFNPLETALLRTARTKHCTLIPGYRMLIYQALAQIELYTGKQASFNVLENALLTALS